MDNKNKSSVNVLIVDDHQLFVEGLQLILTKMNEKFDFVIKSIAYDGSQALALLAKKDIHLMILDLNMPIMDGIELLSKIKRSRDFIQLKTLVLTGYQDDKFTRLALKNGADGILLKKSGSKQLFIAIDKVLKGELYIGEGLRTSPLMGDMSQVQNSNQFDLKHLLTNRELEVLVLVSKGNSNRVVATQLFISPETVSVHRKNIIKKLRLKNTAELIKFAIDYNLI